jgi:hypothetical protein
LKLQPRCGIIKRMVAAGTYIKDFNSRKGNIMKEINRDVKWFIGVVLLLVIAAGVAGSVYISRTGEAAAKNEAIVMAFEEAKQDMAESYDPILAEYIELQEVIESDNRRNEIAYEMILSWPRMSEVYHRMYEEAVRENIWEQDALEENINRIYQESLERAERVSLVLPEEIWIEKQSRRNWTVTNPEDFSFVIPTNPAALIAEDLQRMMELMNFTVDSQALPEESLAKEIVVLLEEDGFFDQYTFEYTPITEENTFRMTMSYNAFNEGLLEELHLDERGRRGELTALTSRKELRNLFVQKIIENGKSNVLIHSMELREYESSNNEGFGYELYHSSAHPEDFSGQLVQGGEVYRIPGFDLEGLKRFYLSTQVDPVLEGVEPRWISEFQESSPLSIEVYGEEIALLIVENGALTFQIYDLETGSLQEASVLVEEYPLISEAEVKEQRDYRIEKHSGYYRIKAAGAAEEIWVAENREDGLFLHPGVAMDTDPEYQAYREEVILHNEMLYLIKTRQQEPQGSFTISVENRTENRLEEVVYVEENMAGGYFISPDHGVMLLYPETAPEEEAVSPANNFSIYDFEQQEMREDLFFEELQGVPINQVVFIDQDRLLILTGDRELWELNLEEESIEPSDITDKLQQVYEGEPEEGIREELQLLPMEEGYYLLSHLRLSDEGIISVSSMIVTDQENRLEAVLKVQWSQDQRVFLNYVEDLLLVARESVEPGPPQRQITLLDIDYHQLDQVEEFIELESIEALISEGYAVELTNFVKNSDTEGEDFFRISPDRLFQHSGTSSSGKMHFNRDTGDLLIKSSAGEDALDGFLRLFKSEDREGETLPLWGFDHLYINGEKELIYYQDERQMLVFGLEDFIPALIRE